MSETYVCGVCHQPIIRIVNKFWPSRGRWEHVDPPNPPHEVVWNQQPERNNHQ